MGSKCLTALLKGDGKRDVDEPFLHFVSESGKPRDLSLRELRARSGGAAGGLLEAGVGRGDRVGILCADGEDFVVSLFAVLRTGAVAVPMSPPIYHSQIRRFHRRTASALRSSSPRAMIVDPAYEDLVAGLRAVEAGLPLLGLKQLRGTVPPIRTSPDDLAIIQYTSGSSGHPKGVALSHGNVMHHLQDIGRGLRLSEDDRAVTWLPLFHDMGLIGMLLSMMAAGTRTWLIPPHEFAFHPRLWLKILTEVKGTITTAPNFAYQLCVDRMTEEDVEGLDLSSLRLALNGAEPVRVRTLRAFEQRFGPVGFRKTAFLPVYGLSEATLAVTFPPLDREPRFSYVDRDELSSTGRVVSVTPVVGRPSISVGRPFPDHEVRIVDRHGVDKPERTQGRIVVRGPSISQGYYNDPEETDRALRDGWLHTGDLGYLDDGELYITGRIKDVLIRAGRNFHAIDVEQAAELVSGVRKGCSAAFAVDEDEDEEMIVVAVEIKRGEPLSIELQREIEESIVREEGVRPDRVFLTPPGTVPKTTSGKVMRAAMRDIFLGRKTLDPDAGDDDERPATE